MIQTGNFPIQNTDPFSTSFFNCTFPRIRRRLQEEHSRVYSAAWSSLFLSLPSTGMQTFLGSLVSTLPTAQNPLERTDAASRSVKDNSRLLRDLLGPLRPDQGDMWVAVSSVLISRTWNDQIVRVLVCWASGLIDEREVNEPGEFSVCFSAFRSGIIFVVFHSACRTCYTSSGCVVINSAQ